MTRVAIIGEAYGRQEAEANRPFIGASGDLLNRLCEESGLIPRDMGAALSRALWQRNFDARDRIFANANIRLTNVFNFQPPGNRIEDLCGPKWGALPPIRPGKYIREEFTHELERLARELDEWKPNLIIGLGATALWFACGTGQITKWRGTVIASNYGKFIATFHPAYMLYPGGWANRAIVVVDLMKAARERHRPDVVRPQRFIHIPESVDDIERAFGDIRHADTLSIDIETANEQITCIGFAWSKDHALVIPIIDTAKYNRSYWEDYDDELEVWRWIRRLCGLPIPKVFQNGLYDMHFLWKQYGVAVSNCEHDTMLLHHALQPEMKKGLGFLGSLYTDEASWKMMRPRGKGTIKQQDE
jgi:uracil-DNA glycosylase